MIRLWFLFATVIIISCSPVKKYQNRPEVLDWENDIKAFEQLDKNVTYPSDALLFAGSSSIKLWSTLERDMEPIPIIQRGYGGARLSDFAVYADRIIAPHQCKAILIFVANDITGDEKDKSPNEAAQLFRNILNTIRKTYPETPVFWIAITPTESRWKVWPEIEKANNLIQGICDKKENTYYIRTDFAFLNENGQPRVEYFRPDKLHLNEDGYAVWTKIIRQSLKDAISIPGL